MSENRYYYFLDQPNLIYVGQTDQCEKASYQTSIDHIEYIYFSNFDSIDHQLKLLPIDQYNFEAIKGINLFYWPFDSSISRGNHLPVEFSAFYQHHEICLYMGSFNPLHQGHIQCVQRFLELNKPLLMVPDQNPWKNTHHQQNETIFVQLKKTFHPLPIVTNFITRNEINYSSSWLPYLAKSLPNCQLSLLLGFDTFSSLLQWKNPELILNSIHHIYWVSREESNKDADIATQQLKDQYPHLNIQWLGHHPYEKLSSSKIKKP